ncbi:MAG TPA: helix-turn-helix transcriptional regulator [Microbacteriaceae bacterium]
MAAQARLDTGEAARIREAQVAQEIRKQRIASDLSQADVAAKMTELGFSMDQSTIAKLESGKRPLRLAEMFALSSVFGLPEIALLTASIGEGSQPNDYLRILAERLQVETDHRDRTRKLLIEQLDLHANVYADAEASMRWIAGLMRFAAADALKSAKPGIGVSDDRTE